MSSLVNTSISNANSNPITTPVIGSTDLFSRINRFLGQNPIDGKEPCLKMRDFVCSVASACRPTLQDLLVTLKNPSSVRLDTVQSTSGVIHGYATSFLSLARRTALMGITALGHADGFKSMDCIVAVHVMTIDSIRVAGIMCVNPTSSDKCKALRAHFNESRINCLKMLYVSVQGIFNAECAKNGYLTEEKDSSFATVYLDIVVELDGIVRLFLDVIGAMNGFELEWGTEMVIHDMCEHTLPILFDMRPLSGKTTAVRPTLVDAKLWENCGVANRVITDTMFSIRTLFEGCSNNDNRVRLFVRLIDILSVHQEQYRAAVKIVRDGLPEHMKQPYTVASVGIFASEIHRFCDLWRPCPDGTNATLRGVLDNLHVVDLARTGLDMISVALTVSCSNSSRISNTDVRLGMEFVFCIATNASTSIGYALASNAFCSIPCHPINRHRWEMQDTARILDGDAARWVHKVVSSNQHSVNTIKDFTQETLRLCHVIDSESRDFGQACESLDKINAFVDAVVDHTDAWCDFLSVPSGPSIEKLRPHQAFEVREAKHHCTHTARVCNCRFIATVFDPLKTAMNEVRECAAKYTGAFKAKRWSAFPLSQEDGPSVQKLVDDTLASLSSAVRSASQWLSFGTTLHAGVTASDASLADAILYFFESMRSVVFYIFQAAWRLSRAPPVPAPAPAPVVAPAVFERSPVFSQHQGSQASAANGLRATSMPSPIPIVSPASPLYLPADRSTDRHGAFVDYMSHALDRRYNNSVVGSDDGNSVVAWDDSN